MRPIVLSLVMLLTACGDSVETKLASCKQELFDLFEKTTPAAAPLRKKMAEGMLNVVKADIGLKMCRDVLAEHKAKLAEKHG